MKLHQRDKRAACDPTIANLCYKHCTDVIYSHFDNK